jgi:predicted phosphoribosyltransferase
MRHVGQTVGGPFAAFADREDAGRQLARYMKNESAPVQAVIAVPSGGVPVGRVVARSFDVPMGIVLVRKLPLPQSTEMGFGAVTLEGDVVVNDEVVDRFGIGEADREKAVEEVLEGLRKRARAFEEARLDVDVEGRDVCLVDDGLATGVTMQAAVAEMRRRGAAGVSVAVPDSPERTLEKIEPLVDDIYCLVAQGPARFAVASFYEHWRDLTDAEVAEMLEKYARQREERAR